MYLGFGVINAAFHRYNVYWASQTDLQSQSDKSLGVKVAQDVSCPCLSPFWSM